MFNVFRNKKKSEERIRKEKTLEKSENYTNVSDSNKTDWGFERTTYIGDVIFGYSHSGNVIMSFDKTTRKQLNTLNIN